MSPDPFDFTCWKSLVLSDVLFKVIAFVLLTPLVSLLFRGFLSISGRTVLADVDIARFLLHPIGWLTLVVVGGSILGIFALEQSALMAISLASGQGKTLSVLASMQFVAGKAVGVFQMTALMVARMFVLTVPFLAAGGGVYLLLLTDHDINYYLAAKPPEFWLAMVLIGAIVTAMAGMVLRCVLNWSIAIPLHLFENVPPRVCLKTSRERVLGSRKVIAKWVLVWGVATALISTLSTGLVLEFGQLVVPASAGSLWRLVLTLGVVLSLWGVVNFCTSQLAFISFALLLGHVYDRFGRSEEFQVPGDEEGCALSSVRWTRGRVLSGLFVAVIFATLVGATAIHTFQLEDDVEITAHRGASGKAPENTMAAILQAIVDKADWVEIDVQESKDGVVLVAHDSDLKKVSGVAVRIWEATADELRSLDIGSYFGPEFKDERVPTLAEVLEACQGKVRVNIELKYYGHDKDLEQKVIDLVEKHDMASDVVVMSLKAEGIRKIKRLRPNWTVGLLTAVAAGDLTRADADFLAVSTKLAKRGLIRSAHKKKKDVHVWTVNDAIGMSTMASRGADNLITDFPDLARRVLEERAEMSPVERILIELAFLFGVAPAEPAEQ